MKVGDILQDKGFESFVVSPEDSLEWTVKAMRRHRVGSMMVLDRTGTLVGILTERDVIGAVVTHGRIGLRLPAEDIMTRHVITCTPDQSVETVHALMERHGVRHLPVMDGDRVIGLVSVRDTLRTLMARTSTEATVLLDRARCRPAPPPQALAA